MHPHPKPNHCLQGYKANQCEEEGILQGHVGTGTAQSVGWMGMRRYGPECGQVRTTETSLVEGEACEGDQAGLLERNGNEDCLTIHSFPPSLPLIHLASPSMQAHLGQPVCVAVLSSFPFHR